MGDEAMRLEYHKLESLLAFGWLMGNNVNSPMVHENSQAAKCFG